MRVILEFWDHANWSDEKTERNLKKVFEYLEKHKIEYGEDPLESYSILIEMSKAEFLEFCSFITEKLRAPPNCIHVPYQVLCVNGDGNLSHLLAPRRNEHR